MPWPMSVCELIPARCSPLSLRVLTLKRMSLPRGAAALVRLLDPALTPGCRGHRLTPVSHGRRAAADPSGYAASRRRLLIRSALPVRPFARSRPVRCLTCAARRFVAIPDFCAVCLTVVRHG